MRVLICADGKHGATIEIAAAIADTLAARGLTVVTAGPEEVRGVEDVDAVVLGSAVYAGHWMPAVKRLVERHADALRKRPVWLFSSGPVGAPEPQPTSDPVDVEPMLAATGAVDHVIFAGRLRREDLNFGERAIVRALRAPEGDFRDWDAIRAYADAIADVLARRRATVAV